MASVNTNSLRSVAGDINDVIGRLKAAASYTESACNSLKNYCTNLTSYNEQKVAEDQKTATVVDPNDESKFVIHSYYNTWVTNDGGIAEAASSLQTRTSELLTIVDGLSAKAGAIDSIADTIDSYINSVEATIGNGTTSSPFIPDSSLCSLASLALGREGVKMSNVYLNGERIDYETFKNTGLSSTQLTYKLQEDGSYRIYSNGKETDYYTNGLSAAFYQKTLMDQTKAKLGDGKDSPAGDNKSTTGDHHATAKVPTYLKDNSKSIFGAAALAGASTTGNRNTANQSTNSSLDNSQVNVLPDGRIQKTIAKSGKSEVRLITGSHNSQICLNDSGKSITPSNDAIESIKSMEHSISKNEGINLSKSSSVEMINQDGSITKYYYNSNDKNQLVRVISTDKNGIQQSFLDNKDYAEKFSQISNLKEGNTRRYLDSNGNCFYETFISENGTDAFG